jgi:hypothetical protein
VLCALGLKGHRTGGSIHFIVNNQIGFTTNPRFSRSSPYPSDVAKIVEAPIFHCNGDDPEAVVFAAKVAVEYRQKFHKPVVVDMFCYRRFGHNEGDEPAFTQPKMYRIIRQHPTTLELYAKKLVAEGTVSEAEIDAAKAAFRAKLDAELEVVEGYRPNKADWLDGRWSGPDRGARGRRGRAARQDRDAGRGAEGDRRANHRGAAGFQSAPHDPAASSTTARRRSRPARASIGRPRRRSPSAGFSPRVTGSVCPGRTSSAAPSRSATRCCSTRRPKTASRR